MAKIALEIVTIERKVWEQEDLDLILLPGSAGDLGIRPRHAPLLTTLRPGVIMTRRGSEEEFFAVGGGFADVHGHKVVVLAEAAEHSEEIDIEQAEEARRRAAELLASPPDPGVSVAAMKQALMLSEARIKVVRRRRPGMGGGRPDGMN